MNQKNELGGQGELVFGKNQIQYSSFVNSNAGLVAIHVPAIAR